MLAKRASAYRDSCPTTTMLPEQQQQYKHLTNQVMPEVARQQHWPVRLNHCFQRIILDTLFQDCWYNHLDRANRTPAYRQLSEQQLEDALAIAQRMLDSPETVRQLNRESLRYRGKLRTERQ